MTVKNKNKTKTNKIQSAGGYNNDLNLIDMLDKSKQIQEDEESYNFYDMMNA